MGDDIVGPDLTTAVRLSYQALMSLHDLPFTPAWKTLACAARVTVVGSVCLSVKSHLTYGGSVRPETAVTYSAGNEGQNICGVFSETAPLQRSSTPSVVRPCVQSAIFLRKARMRIIVFTTWWTGSGHFLLCAGAEKTVVSFVSCN